MVMLTYERPTCVCTVIAMHIEMALDAAVDSSDRLMARSSIHSGLSYLRETSHYWSGIKWLLRMFDVIVTQTSLVLDVCPDVPRFDVKSMNPFVSSFTHEVTQSFPFDGHLPPIQDQAVDDPIGGSSEDWFENLFNSNPIGLYEDQTRTGW